MLVKHYGPVSIASSASSYGPVPFASSSLVRSVVKGTVFELGFLRTVLVRGLGGRARLCARVGLLDDCF